MVLIYTFRGGIHMEEYKYTAGSPIEKMPAPNRVYVPLSQHIGAPCTATVKKDDIMKFVQAYIERKEAKPCLP